MFLGFQSSALPKKGCNSGALQCPAGQQPFQSSALPKKGCNALTRAPCNGSRPFQSSALPKKGCNPQRHAGGQASQRFQSSALPKKGCNEHYQVASDALGRVSILSPSEEGLQPPVALPPAFVRTFQSSALPKKGCNPLVRARSSSLRGFNPQPFRRRAATIRCREEDIAQRVSILSPSEEGLQQHLSRVVQHEPRFQSSALPKKGCNDHTDRTDHARSSFNPQPFRRRAATISSL